jgi:signal transduction histidine kinase
MLRCLLLLLLLALAHSPYAQHADAFETTRTQISSYQTTYTLYGQLYPATKAKAAPQDFYKLTNLLFSEKLDKLPSNCLVRLLIENTDNIPLQLTLNISNNQLDTVLLYEMPDTIPILIYKTGYRMPFNTRPIRSGSIYLPFIIAPHATKHYYLQLINNENRATTRVELQQSNVTFTKHINRTIVVSLFTGIIFFAFLYNLFLYINTRKQLYIHYCAYVLSVSFYMLYDEGYIFHYLIPNHPILNSNIYFIASYLSVGFSINFVIAFVSQGKPTKTFSEKLLYSLMFVNLAGALITLLFNLHLPATEYARKITLYCIITISALALFIYLLKETLARNIFAWFYIAASAMLSIAVTFLVLNFFELIDNHPLRINLLYAGIITEIILLSFFFAWQYNRLQAEKLELQQQLTQQQKQMYLQIINTQEQERKRIAQDLHDGILGFLGALRLFINSKIHHYQQQANAQEEQQNYTHIQQKLDTVIHDLRNLSHDLMPKDFEHITLNELLETHFHELNHQNTTRFQYIGDEKINQLPQHIRINVYRIITELAGNIIRHANAANATIQCISHPNYLLLQAEDDGNGFNTQQTTNGIGLKNIHSRVEYLKGKITIDSNKFATTIIIEIPLEEQTNNL